MIEIVPAILPEDIQEIREKLTELMEVVSYVQIDFCDGVYVKSKTWPFNHSDDYVFEQIVSEEEGLPYWDRFNFEFDLMVKDASKSFDTFIKLGASRIIFHLEAEENENEFLEFLEGIDLYIRDNVEIGVAIKQSTLVSKLDPLIAHLDFVQLMGIKEIGKQGQEFDEGVLEQIRTLRAKYPELVISVDGGVDKSTVSRLREAGVNRLVVGSDIWKANDIPNEIRCLESL